MDTTRRIRARRRLPAVAVVAAALIGLAASCVSLAPECAIKCPPDGQGAEHQDRSDAIH